ncbi:hypothetical protein LG299_15795 [Microbacterium lacus]|uniref:hypothetical protein n=1 Tax=Microbacterium lacus TaxID=415217 RepID=UPI00384EF32E
MDEVVEYLRSGDPAIRWQVLRDLTDASADDIARERARVADEGWGAQLLAEQSADGRWDGGTYRPGWADESRPFFDAWTATHFSLQQLMDFGIDPGDPRVRAAIARVRENVRWEHDNEPYFEGETEPCINGTALAVAAYFGEDGHAIAETLLASQLPDGGWNCWDEDGTSASSFHSTICALEGLWAWEQSGTVQDPDAAATTRRRGEEYLLERSLLRRVSNGALIDPRFGMASYPVRWYFDYLRALEYFRLARPEGDPRCGEAVALLRSAQLPMGLWSLELTHEGPRLFSFEQEGEGRPSRWVTLRALRVLRWADSWA